MFYILSLESFAFPCFDFPPVSLHPCLSSSSCWYLMSQLCCRCLVFVFMPFLLYCSLMHLSFYICFPFKSVAPSLFSCFAVHCFSPSALSLLLLLVTSAPWSRLMIHLSATGLLWSLFCCTVKASVCPLQLLTLTNTLGTITEPSVIILLQIFHEVCIGFALIWFGWVCTDMTPLNYL